MKKRMLPLVLAAIILIFSGCGKSERNNSYLLTRVTPDFTPYVGFLDTDYLIGDRWTSVTCENPVTGVTTRINLSNVKSSVERTDSSGHQEREISNGTSHTSGVSGSFTSLYTWYTDEGLIGKTMPSADYRFEENGAIRQITYSKPINQGTPQSSTIYAHLYFIYDDQGRLKTQTYTPFEEGRFTRSYFYDGNGNLSRWEETDADGTLLAYTDYHFYGTQRTTKIYSADGTLTELAIADFNEEGLLLQSSRFGPDGNLLQKVSYGYDTPPYPFTIYHYILFALLGVAIAVYLYWQVVQIIRNRRYNRAPTIEIRARLLEKSEGSGSAMAESSYYGVFETTNGRRFQLAMEKDHYYLLPENIWGTLRYKSGWMVSFYEE